MLEYGAMDGSGSEARKETPKDKPGAKQRPPDSEIFDDPIPWTDAELAARPGLANLKGPFKRGNPGLPGAGRPRKDGIITSAYRKLLRKKVPGDKENRRFIDLYAYGVMRAACSGKADAAREIADRVEGRSRGYDQFEPVTAINVHIHENVERSFKDDDLFAPPAIDGDA